MMKQLLLHIPWNEVKSGHAAHCAPVEAHRVSDQIGFPGSSRSGYVGVCGSMKIHFTFPALNIFESESFSLGHHLS